MYVFSVIENYMMEGDAVVPGPVAVPVEAVNPADPVPKPSKRVKKLRNKLHQRDIRSPKKCTGVRSVRRFENCEKIISRIVMHVLTIVCILCVCVNCSVTVFSNQVLCKVTWKFWGVTGVHN